MSELTVEKLREAMRELEKIQGPPVSTGLLYPSLGISIPIYETPLLVETEEYQETEQLTFWQRWIEPISTFLNFQTMPFEPWVKSRTVTKTRQVPSRQILRTQMGLFMHPVLRREFSAINQRKENHSDKATRRYDKQAPNLQKRRTW